MDNRPSLSGLSKITDERIYQMQKGWTMEHDRETHQNGSLASAAWAMLNPHLSEPDYEKERWIEELQEKYENDYEDSLRIAGALIAAELSRISD